MSRRTQCVLPGAAVILLFTACADSTGPVESSITPSFAVTASASLGELLFNDVNLSVNRNQSCRSCHEPAEGFAAPLSSVTTHGSVVQGSVAGRFGDRKPPSAAYATLSPLFAASGGGASGGNFWDGRATGAILGSPAADQALGPFINPAEQALPDVACVVYRVRTGAYVNAYTAVWSTNINTISFPASTETICSTPATSSGQPVSLTAADRARVQTEYYNIARSVRDFEATLNTFSSKNDGGTLTALEAEGRKLFSGKGKCQQCHTNKGAKPLYSDNNYHNLGVPRNPANPVHNYITGTFDPGLGGFTGRASHIGKFRTPTLRNVARGSNRSYMHNGVLTSLRQVVDFYSTRDVTRRCTPAEIAVLQPSQYGNIDPDGAGPLTAAGCWPPAEFAQNLDTKNMGNLGLTAREIDAVVAYMMALTDQ